MNLEFLIQFLAIPATIAISPAITVFMISRKLPNRNTKIKKWILGFYVLWFCLILWSYYSVWGLLYGPMSSEDLGPGIVSAIAIVLFQIAPLVITAPFAFLVFSKLKKYNKSFQPTANAAG